MDINFKKIIYSNIQSIGNTPIEIDLNKHKKTLIVGSNGTGKCLRGNTKIDVLFVSSNKKVTIKIKALYEYSKSKPNIFDDIKVNTRFGYKRIEACEITAKNSKIYKVTTTIGRYIEGSPDHQLFTNDWIKIKNLTTNDKLLTEDGLEQIESIKLLDFTEDLYDLQVEEVKEFYANGIVSHNSTLLEAITFGLFGTPFRSVKKQSIINRINKKKLLVELFFSVGTDEYYIKRGMKPDCLEISKNNVRFNELSSVKDFQNWFELNCLKMNIQTFKQIILIGTAGYIPFMQLTGPARRVVVEDICDISVFSTMNDINKTLVKNINVEMSEMDIKLSSKLNEINAYSLLLQEQQKNKDSQKDELLAQINSIKNEINVLNTDLDSNMQSLVEIQTNMITDQSEFINKCNMASNLVLSKISDNKKTISFFNTNDNCPTCQQNIDSNFKNSIIKTNEDAIVNFETKLKEVNKKLASYKENQKQYNLAIEECNQYKQKIYTNKNLIQDKENSIVMLTSKLNALDTNSVLDSSKLDELSNEVKVLKERKNELFKEKYARMLIVNMLKDSGIKSKVIKKYIPKINFYLNKYLKLLGADYVFVLDEEFNEQVVGSGWDKMSYNNFSEGEKARINISIMFTWKKIASLVSGITVNLLILDEVFDSSTDVDGVKEINSLIDELDANTIVISHRETNDSADFDKTIIMKKQGRFSIMS